MLLAVSLVVPDPNLPNSHPIEISNLFADIMHLRIPVYLDWGQGVVGSNPLAPTEPKWL